MSTPKLPRQHEAMVQVGPHEYRVPLCDEHTGPVLEACAASGPVGDDHDLPA